MFTVMSKYLIYIGIALVVALGVAGSGFYLKSILADRARLEREVSLLKASEQALERVILKDRAALLEAEKAAQSARTQAARALNRIKDAKNDKASADWLNQPLPDGVLRALRTD